MQGTLEVPHVAFEHLVDDRLQSLILVGHFLAEAPEGAPEVDTPRLEFLSLQSVDGADDGAEPMHPPGFVNRPLGSDEMDAYRLPFRDPADRGAILKWPREVPIAGEPAAVAERLQAFAAFMTSTELPLLLIYADPGVVVQAPVVEWYTANLRNLEKVFVGQGLHFLQEGQPDAIGRAMREWGRRHVWGEVR